MKRNANTYLTRDEIRALLRPSDLRGALSIALCWALIGLSLALIAAFPANPLAWLVALVLLGGRQLALGILMHECAHHSLFATRWANDAFGKWLCAALVWQRLDAYRKHHLLHHAHTSLDEDTDLNLIEPFPCSRESLRRKFLRDLTGRTFVRRTVGLVLMDAGVLTYSASGGQRRVTPRPSRRAMLTNLMQNAGPVLLTNAALYAICASAGHGFVYLGWLLAHATVYNVFVRVRAVAEHAVLERTADPFRNTRTTEANWLARLTVAPIHVNHHLEHHLLPTVPHYRLPKLSALLRQRGAYEHAPHASGYCEVLALATSAPPRAPVTPS
ncbi:MAG: fatty acid desaturase family protein [Polyangiales bacterium]